MKTECLPVTRTYSEVLYPTVYSIDMSYQPALVSVTPALGRLGQSCHEFEASLDYTNRQIRQNNETLSQNINKEANRYVFFLTNLKPNFCPFNFPEACFSNNKCLTVK